MKDEQFWTCHAMHGASIQVLLDDVLQFTTKFPKEIIILDFNHFYGIDTEHHQQLISKIEETFERKLWPSRLASYTLNQAWDSLVCTPLYRELEIS